MPALHLTFDGLAPRSCGVLCVVYAPRTPCTLCELVQFSRAIMDWCASGVWGGAKSCPKMCHNLMSLIIKAISQKGAIRAKGRIPRAYIDTWRAGGGEPSIRARACPNRPTRPLSSFFCLYQRDNKGQNGRALRAKAQKQLNIAGYSTACPLGGVP